MITPPQNFDQLAWTANYVERFPGDPETRNFTRPVKRALYSLVHPTPVSHPVLGAWSQRLGDELKIKIPEPNSDALRILAGNFVTPQQKPYAARYGGHQFGNWAGQLGDGRAITLGEAVTNTGRFEFQLKGAGPTPYSRRADGRAVLRSSVREFLCSEAMHFLGVPTTRALSLVTTGDSVVRDLFYDGNPKPEPGAVVCRVAPSFLRFGNFEILASANEHHLLEQLTRDTVEAYFPAISLSDPDHVGLFLDQVARSTALMIAEWMRVGFVHGVMNTDNMSVLGLTLDYGPYGWLEPFDPGWTPNTTDAEGRRYRYGGQPSVGLWNVSRFAEALFPLIQDEARVNQSLSIYRESFQDAYGAILAAKLGLPSLEQAGDETLIEDLFKVLAKEEADFTLFFRKLSEYEIGMSGSDFLFLIRDAFYSPTTVATAVSSEWSAWGERYGLALKRTAFDQHARRQLMNKTNPKFVFRNYLAQNAITLATTGDFSQVERLLRVLEHPYEDQKEESELSEKRPEWARNAPGCSALSCSS